MPSGDFFKDLGGLGLPDEGFGIDIVVLQVGLNGRLEISHAFEDAAANGILCNEAEEALDLIEPGGGGRGEVEMDTLMPSQPRLDVGVLVGGVVVDDQMQVQVLGGIAVDGLEEAQDSW